MTMNIYFFITYFVLVVLLIASLLMLVKVKKIRRNKGL